VDWPASDPLALAVGGTSLQASRTTGAYLGETAWNLSAAAVAGSSPAASGGGFSRVFPRAAYQDGIAGIGAARGVPDVAADADPSTGMALAFSDGGQAHILIGAGGTSAAAPLWAAVIALADQYAGRNLGFVNPALYGIGHSTYYHQAFHDVTTGTNTVEAGAETITGYQAAPGWDPVTGWGSPNAQILVPLLARYASPDPGRRNFSCWPERWRRPRPRHSPCRGPGPGTRLRIGAAGAIEGSTASWISSHLIRTRQLRFM
jgi:subtilase family serine protease